MLRADTINLRSLRWDPTGWVLNLSTGVLVTREDTEKSRKGGWGKAEAETGATWLSPRLAGATRARGQVCKGRILRGSKRNQTYQLSDFWCLASSTVIIIFLLLEATQFVILHYRKLISVHGIVFSLWRLSGFSLYLSLSKISSWHVYVGGF